jgi:hypothetical protein
MKANGVFDVLSMSLFSKVNIPDWYFVCIINSMLLSFYVDNFINNTSHFQINDARQLPVIIPSEKQFDDFEKLFNAAIAIKKKQISNKTTVDKVETELSAIQEKLDRMVVELYRIV